MKAFRLKGLISKLQSMGYAFLEDETSMMFSTSYGDSIEFHYPSKEVIVSKYHSWSSAATIIDMELLSIIVEITKTLGWLDA